jgi:hypothetical protein
MHRPSMIAAALLALAGCGRGGGEANRQSAPAGEAPANIIIATADGTAEIRTGTGAAGLPEGIPAYPGADPNAAVQVTGGAPGAEGGLFGFRTSDAPAQVIAFYAAAAGSGGYRIANRMEMGATATLTAEKGDGTVINVIATPAGGFTQVQLIVGHDRH